MLTCIGDLTVDVITWPKGQITRETEQKAGILFCPGGQAANCARFAAEQKVETTFFARSGNDFLGNWIIKKLEDKGVNCRVKQKGKTAVTTALVSEGERTFLNDPGANTQLCMEDIDFEEIKNSEHVHVGGYWALDSLRNDLPELFSYARKNNVQSSLSIGWDPNGWEKREELLELLELVDVFFLNEKEALALTEEKNLEKALEKMGSLPVVHMGSKGCLVNGTQVPAKKVEEKNPVGSGDAFNAAFIKHFMEGRTPEKSAEEAVKFASKQINKTIPKGENNGTK